MTYMVLASNLMVESGIELDLSQTSSFISACRSISKTRNVIWWCLMAIFDSMIRKIGGSSPQQ